MLMPFNDYVRAYRVIRSVLESYPSADPNNACIAFAIGGMKILRKHYDVEATVSVGGAVYVLGTDDTDVLAYGRNENGVFVADRDAFHCWVQAEDYAIDFMAPLFPEVMRREGRPTKSVPKMFQKPHAEVRYLDDLKKPGDFAYHTLDQDTAVDILQKFLAEPQYEDMWMTMTRWFVPLPKKIRRSVELFDQRTNGMITIHLSNALVDGTL